MRIETNIQPSLHRAPVIIPGSAQTPQVKSQKSLGDVAPVRLSLPQIAHLATLFAANGKIRRLQKKLNYLKSKNCEVVPAKGTIACIDDSDTVYLGVDFLAEYQDDFDTLAGVMAHEWGHSCAKKPNQHALDSMNWPEIFKLRKEHEALADYIAGRLLHLLGASPDGMIALLKKVQTGGETEKYYDADTRAKIIRAGFTREGDLKGLAHHLFPRQVYANHYHGRLIEIV